MEKLFNLLMKFGLRFGSSSVYYLIVGVAAVFFIPLFYLAIWVLLEISGLMAQRTGIREGFWVFLITLANLHFAMKPSNKFFKLAGIVRNVLLGLYLVNGVAMLWDDRPLVFWFLLLGTITHIGGLFFQNKLPKNEVYVTSRRVS